jgi:hypothetical protein
MSKEIYYNYGNLEWGYEKDDKTPARMLMTLPLGELDEPITTGRELLDFLGTCLNKDRYAFRNRGRGCRKHATGYTRDLTLDQAERVAVYFEEKESVIKKEIAQRQKARDRSMISQKLRELSRELHEHQQKYGDDVLIMQKKEK